MGSILSSCHLVQPARNLHGGQWRTFPHGEGEERINLEALFGDPGVFAPLVGEGEAGAHVMAGVIAVRLRTWRTWVVLAVISFQGLPSDASVPLLLRGLHPRPGYICKLTSMMSLVAC